MPNPSANMGVTQELKACPFCGGEAMLCEIPTSLLDDGEEAFWVTCIDCGGGFDPSQTRATAIIRWNTRTISLTGAAGPWLRVGTFEPTPEARYLVQGVLRTSVKRGKDIDADNLFAAEINEPLSTGAAGSGEVERKQRSIATFRSLIASLEELDESALEYVRLLPEAKRLLAALSNTKGDQR